MSGFCRFFIKLIGIKSGAIGARHYQNIAPNRQSPNAAVWMARSPASE
jgi:hypothetical protein